MRDEYLRKATLEKVVDGDTFVCIIDLGLRIYKKATIRILGINCPETKGLTRQAGLSAKAFTKEWFAKNPEFNVRTVNSGKEDKYGRLLAEVISLTESNLASELLSAGLAVPFMEQDL